MFWALLFIAGSPPTHQTLRSPRSQPPHPVLPHTPSRAWCSVLAATAALLLPCLPIFSFSSCSLPRLDPSTAAAAVLLLSYSATRDVSPSFAPSVLSFYSALHSNSTAAFVVSLSSHSPAALRRMQDASPPPSTSVHLKLVNSPQG